MSYTAPSVVCEVALTKSPLSLPSGGDWVALSQVVVEYSMDRGKQDQLATHQPARVTIVLDNGDTDLDQSLPASKGNTAWNSGTAYTTADGVTYGGRHYNCISNHTNHVPPNATYWEQASQIGGDNALPYTPIRLKVNGTVVFTGYTEAGWEPTGSMFGAGTVTVNATDWLGWAATKTMPDSAWAAWVTRERPRLWLRGDVSVSNLVTSSDHLYNMAQRWTGAYGDFTPNTPTYDGTTVRVPGIATDANGYAISQEFVTTWASVTANPLETITPTTEWSVAFWMKADTPLTQYYGTSGAGDIWWFDTDASGYLRANVMRGGATVTATISVDHCDGNPHVVLCQVVSQGALKGVYLASDLGSNSNGFATSGATGGGQIELNGRDSSVIGEFCYWDSGSGGHASWQTVAGWFDEPVIGSGLTLAQQATAWEAGGAVGSDDTRADRVTELGKYAVVTMPTANITVDDASDTLWSYGVESTLADAVRVLGESWLGDVFMERAGDLRIYDSTYTSSDADDYDTVHAQITDDPAASAPPVILRASGGGRSGTRVERVVNDVRVNLTVDLPGPEVLGSYVFDLTSQQRYGVKSKTFTSQATNYLTTPLTDYLAAHKDPPIEIPDVVLQPWGDQDITDFVVGTVELERRVSYRKALPFPSSAEVIDQECRIIGEKWTWRNGAGDSAADWTVTLRLEPV